MQEIIRVLWEYASRYCIDGFYDRDTQQSREQCTRAICLNREELEKICPPDISQRIDALCGCWEELRDGDMEAAFACGFRLGASLR